jgi:hypothetical protein
MKDRFSSAPYKWDCVFKKNIVKTDKIANPPNVIDTPFKKGITMMCETYQQ